MSSSWWTKRPETDMFDAFRDMMLSSNNTRDQRIPKRSPPKSVDVHLGPRLSCKTRGTQHSVPSSQKQQFRREMGKHCVRTKLSRCGGIVRCSPTTNPQLPLLCPPPYVYWSLECARGVRSSGIWGGCSPQRRDWLGFHGCKVGSEGLVERKDRSYVNSHAPFLSMLSPSGPLVALSLRIYKA